MYMIKIDKFDYTVSQALIINHGVMPCHTLFNMDMNKVMKWMRPGVVCGIILCLIILLYMAADTAALDDKVILNKLQKFQKLQTSITSFKNS